MPMPPAAPCTSTHSPGLHPSALQQRVVGGGIRAAEHAGRLHAHARRHEIAQRGLGVAKFGTGAEAVAAHHRVADAELRDAGTDRDDHAGRLAAGNERRLGAELILAGQHQHVDVLHAARLDAHLHLAGPGGGGSGTSRNANTSGPPNASHTTAFICDRPLAAGDAVLPCHRRDANSIGPYSAANSAKAPIQVSAATSCRSICPSTVQAATMRSTAAALTSDKDDDRHLDRRAARDRCGRASHASSRRGSSCPSRRRSARAPRRRSGPHR